MSNMEEVTIPLLEIKEVGVVHEIREGIIKLKGFRQCIYGQLVEFPGGVRGMIVGFDSEVSFALVLGDERKIKVGDRAISIPELVSVGVGDGYLGRVVNSLGRPIDDQGNLQTSQMYPIFREARGIMDREPINEQLCTGIKMLDLLIPIGKGQRELIVGDRQSGKTSIALDVIFNQKGKNVICIYCFVGGSYSRFTKILHHLKEKEALPYTICVCASGANSVGEQFLAPYTAAALGEYFMFNGKDVFVVFDDLSKHAWVWREISLLLERSPGREAYPADIFFIHSQLMERAGKLNKTSGGGTMTFFPIVETLQGDITGFIQSNLVSMTDGQVYLDTALFYQGFKPAIDLGLSVSRIGGKIQCPALRSVSAGLRLEYLQYRELLRLAKLRARLSSEAALKLKSGEVLERIFTQQNYHPCLLEEEIILFYAFKRKILDVLSNLELMQFKDDFFSFISRKNPSLVAKVGREKDLTEEIRKQLDGAFVEYFRQKKKAAQ